MLGENARIAAPPLPLVERELEARIEAKTAARYRQRRRAAKVARRIAALPPTLFQGEAGAFAEPDTPQPTQISPDVVDLPAAAVHEVTSRAIVDHPAEPVVEVVIDPAAMSAPPAPEPVVETAPVAPRRRRRRRPTKVARPEHARADVEVEPEAGPQTEALEDARDAEPVEQPPSVEPVVEPVVAIAAEPVLEPAVEAAPIAAASWQPRANSAWIDRVFNSAPGAGRTQSVSWPRTPRAPIVDPATESVTDQGSEAAG